MIERMQLFLYLMACSKEVTSQLNYTTIKVSSDWKKIHGKKQNNFVISFFILLQ